MTRFSTLSSLKSVPVVGTSFGGMMACELAAYRPDRISKIVLLDPIGLWRDDAPVAPYMLMPPEKLVATLYKHLDAAPVQRAIKMPERPEGGGGGRSPIWSGRSARPGNSSGRYPTRA